jgi:hypothetical protein
MVETTSAGTPVIFQNKFAAASFAPCNLVL